MHVGDRGWVLGRATLVLALIASLLIGVASSGQVGAAGLNLLGTLLVVDFGFVTATAVGPFASGLAEEKEGDTLGVLRLAGLSPGAIVASKALGLLASALLLLLVQVPFAILATTLGGVGRAHVATAFVTLFAYTLASQGVALAVAARAQTSKQAGTRTAWILASWLLLPLLLEAASAWAAAVATGGSPKGSPGVLATLAEGARQASPLFAALPAADLPAPPLLTSAAWLCLAIAALGFALAVHGIARAPAQGRAPRRPRSRRPRVHGLRTQALVWKEENFLLGGAAGQRRRAAVYVVAVLLIGLLTYDPRGGWLATWSSLSLQAFFVIAYIELGMAASHLYRDELRERTLFGLALLPIPPMTWAAGKAQGVLRVARVPLWAMLIAYFTNRLFAGRTFPGWIFAAVGFGFLAVNLTLFLSLWLPRGAFLVATALVALPAAMVTAGGATGELFTFCSVYIGGPLALGLLGWLQVQIGRRLRELATRY